MTDRGPELGKLQRRIGRQRKVLAKQHRRIKRQEEELYALRQELQNLQKLKAEKERLESLPTIDMLVNVQGAMNRRPRGDDPVQNRKITPAPIGTPAPLYTEWA